MGAARDLKRRINAKKQRKNPLYKEQRKVQREERRAEQSMGRAEAHSIIEDMRIRRNAFQTLSAVFWFVMHEQYKFGVGRIKRLRDKMQSEMDCICGKYVTVEDIAAFLREELKCEFGIAAKPTGLSHYRQIEFGVVKEMSAAFLMALVDEFGFRKKRLEDAYGYAVGLSKMLEEDKITYQEIGSRMEEVLTKGGKKNESAKNNAATGGKFNG